MSDVMNVAQKAGKVTTTPQNDVLGAMVSSGRAWWDMMLGLQRASLQSLSVYSPGADARISGALPHRAAGVAVVPVGEERLNVATRVVQGETTRVRRRVVEQPVEQEVLLRDEKVVVERRPRPAGAAANAAADVLTDTVVEMSDSSQVPAVWKSVHVGEEVVLRRQVTERTERVRETLRRDVVDVEHGRAEVPAPPAPERRIEAEGAERHVEAQGQAAKQQAEAQAADRKPSDQGFQAPQLAPRKN